MIFLTHKKWLPCFDIMTLLRRCGKIVEMPMKNEDKFDIQAEAWPLYGQTLCSLVAYIPSAAFLGRDRILVVTPQ